MRRRVVSFRDSAHKPNLLFGAEAADDGNRPEADLQLEPGLWVLFFLYQDTIKLIGPPLPRP